MNHKLIIICGASKIVNQWRDFECVLAELCKFGRACGLHVILVDNIIDSRLKRELLLQFSLKIIQRSNFDYPELLCSGYGKMIDCGDVIIRSYNKD